MKTILKHARSLGMLIAALAFTSCADTAPNTESCRIHKVPTQQKKGFLRNDLFKSTSMNKDERDFMIIFPPTGSSQCYNLITSRTQKGVYTHPVQFPWCPRCQAEHDSNKAKFDKLTPSQRAAAREEGLKKINSILGRSLDMEAPDLDLPPPPKDL
ncbi:hypothetical protein SAMN02745181_0353 [Rubritalea squalenifaciens DSM 18772]|uniref:Lipoprotein n=1 Tax=Rubritalea squalenifaciens DSM 18772 TaxID=1123071 RepID=A0A1M6C0C4_9BACT|nr:hypothetical protein [Rubritalea squalenifaciens]SHI54353.1 hypothetical protein SAMN02745181_0353 [Rubritalea squalenifaciens DSM 18772]